MNAVQICGFFFLAIILSALLHAIGSQYGKLIPVFVGILFFTKSITVLSPMVTGIAGRLISTPFSGYVGIVAKCFAVGCAAGFLSDLSRDVGESSLCGKIEAGGKVLILVTLVPLIEELLTVVEGLFGAV